MFTNQSNRFFVYILALSVALNSIGCTSLRKTILPYHPAYLSGGMRSCNELTEIANKAGTTDRLAFVYVMHDRGCFKNAIELAKEIRKTNRDKYYNIKDELAETVFYEGYVKDYVLEAYERIYLSILTSLSYKKMGNLEDAKVELRRANEEMNAQIYTYAEDEITLLLMGALWDQFGSPSDAEPFYRRIIENKDYVEPVREYAQQRLDQPKNFKLFQQVVSMGNFPIIDYSLIGRNNEIYEPTKSIKTCVSDRTLILDTRNWIQQINSRDRADRDAILNLKRAARLPATLLYTALVLATTGGVTYLVAQSGSGELTALASIIAVSLTYMTFKDGMSPDMRYWENLPQAFLFTSKDNNWKNDPCLKPYSAANRSYAPLF